MMKKQLMILFVAMLMVITPLTPAVSSDADGEFQVNASYFGGVVSVYGTVPEGYVDESHIEFTIQTNAGSIRSPAYTVPLSDRTFYQDIRCSLEIGSYTIVSELFATSKTKITSSTPLEVKEGMEAKEVTSISIESTLRLTVGDSPYRMICKFTPEDASDKSLTWESSSPTVASVSSVGVVTPLSAGTTTIKATSVNGKVDTCAVTVVGSSSGGSSAGSLSITASSYSVYADGGKITLSVSSLGNVAVSALRWSVDDSSKAAFLGSTDGVSSVTLAGKAAGTVKVSLYTPSGLQDTISISVVQRGDSTYTFTLRMDLDYDKARYGSSGFTADDLKHGITLTGTGANAGAALESTLRSHGITCSFWSGGDILYWVDQIFGMEQVHYSNGNWKYWIQYHNGSYNQWTLGHYTDGGSFELVYGITNEDGQVVRPSDQPEESSNSGTNTNPTIPDVPNNPTTDDTSQDTGTISDTTSTETTNSDGSKTIEQETTNSDGSSSSTSVTEKKNEDGSTTYDVEQTNTSSDGSSTVSTSQSTVKQGEDGSTITETTSSTHSVDSEGNTTGSTEQVSTSTETTDKDGNKQTVTDLVVTSKDASGNATSSTESKTTETVKKDGSVEKVVEETVKDASGNVSSTKSVEETTKASKNSAGEDQVETTKVETVKDASGNATSSTESKTIETVKKDGSVEKVVEETVKDASGNVSLIKSVEETVKATKMEDGANKTETSTVETVKDAEGNQSSKMEVDKTVTEKVNDDGSVQKDTETSTKVTDASGNVTEIKETVNATKDSSGLMNVKTTETTAADGTKTVEKVINAQTTDGSLRTTADVSGSEPSDVTTTLKVESSDDGNVELSNEIIQKALEQQDKVSEVISDVSQGHNKVIEVKAESEDTIMSMPQESFKGLSDNGSDLKMTSSRGSLTFSNDVLSNLSDMEDVSLSFTRADRSSMNEAQRNAVSQDSSIIDLKAMAGGESVGDRLGGNVDVAVKHTPADGKTPVAYYLDYNGQKQRMEDQWFEKGIMHFRTNHFSLYVIEDEDPNAVPVDPIDNNGSGSNSTILYVGVAVAIIAIIAVAGILRYRKN